MPLPDLESVMLPLLRFMGDGKPHATGDAEAYLAEFFQFTPSKSDGKSGAKSPRLRSRVTGATTQFKQASLVEPVSRGVYKITARGLELLANAPTTINLGFLRSLSAPARPKPSNGHSETNPREDLRRAFSAQGEALRAEVLGMVKSCSSSCFEQVVIDLLVAMGYGGPRARAGSQIGRTVLAHGKEGSLEAVIKAHKLGHEAVYVLAHRWPESIGASVSQRFANVLEGVPARNGVIITTSDFTEAAIGVFAESEKKIFPIDGPELARLMIHHNIGVSEEQRYIVKQVIASYFGTDV